MYPQVVASKKNDLQNTLHTSQGPVSYPQVYNESLPHSVVYPNISSSQVYTESPHNHVVYPNISSSQTLLYANSPQNPIHTSTNSIYTPPLPSHDSVAVIGPQYCAAVPVQLIFSKIYTDQYTAQDSAGRMFFRCEVKNGKRMLLDYADNCIFYFKNKTITSSHACYGYRGDDKIFTVKKSSSIKGLKVFLKSEKGNPDFRVNGSGEYTFYAGTREIACAKRRAGAMKYDVNISAGVDSAFIIALMLIVDNVLPKEEKKNSETATVAAVEVFSAAFGGN